MGRPSLAIRARNVLGQATAALEPPVVRMAVLTAGVMVPLALHVALSDARVAWLAAPVALIAGIAGGVRAALLVAIAAALGHAAIDIGLGIRLGEVPGVLARTLVLPALALAGSAGADVEAQRERAMYRAVTEDPVTGLLNVRAFYDELGRLRRAGTPFAILLADIRGMRALNDQYGHPTGTEAMRAMAHVLRRSAGTNVLASRLGSDEIAVALVGEDRDRCRRIVDQVVSRLRDERVSLPDGDRFEVHAAYGIARFPEDGDDEVAVLRAADRAKERAKVGGLDRVDTASGEPA